MNINPCILLYNSCANGVIYGETEGICRITGQLSKGILFTKWVSDRFNNYADLYEGTIISNEALFCFSESSEVIARKVGKFYESAEALFEHESAKTEAYIKKSKTENVSPKDIGYIEVDGGFACLQRFRTYSHILTNDLQWHVCTKADKRKIIELLQGNPKIVCLSDSGQKHLFFKNRIGMWQLDNSYIEPDIERFMYLHGIMMSLLELGFSQQEIISGNYYPNNILKVGLSAWEVLENKIKAQRGEPFFAFTAWLMYSNKNKDNDI